MAIGVFDSGVGGLTVHRRLVDRFPTADFIYLADQANAPYGGRGGEEIVDLTRAGCERLFEAGANLVVLACNTASAIALRRLQQTWLPDYQAVLGIIVPTIEAATGRPWEHLVNASDDKIQALEILGVFCTAATAMSRVYEIEIEKRRQDLAAFTEPCQGLAGTPLIHQPSATADALERYFGRHPEYEIGTSGRRRFLTTGQPGRQSDLVSQFWGAPLTFEPA